MNSQGMFDLFRHNYNQDHTCMTTAYRHIKHEYQTIFTSFYLESSHHYMIISTSQTTTSCMTATITPLYTLPYATINMHNQFLINYTYAWMHVVEHKRSILVINLQDWYMSSNMQECNLTYKDVIKLHIIIQPVIYSLWCVPQNQHQVPYDNLTTTMINMLTCNEHM